MRLMPPKTYKEAILSTAAGDFNTAITHLANRYPKFQQDVYEALISNNDIQGVCTYIYELSAGEGISDDLAKTIYGALNDVIHSACLAFNTTIGDEPILITEEMADTLQYALAYQRGYDMDDTGGAA